MNAITAEKLPRFQYIIENQTDRNRFAEKVRERFANAEEIIVVDPTGLNFHYFPRFASETKEKALMNRPVAISKSFVENYNKQLVEDNPTPETPIDLDTVEVLVAQLTAWTNESILKGGQVLTTDDDVRIVSGHGTNELGKFIYLIGKNAKLIDNVTPQQSRLSNPRSDIQTLVANLEGLTDGVVEIASSNPKELAALLAAKLNGDQDETALAAGELPVLFADDLLVPVRHLREGQVYPIDVLPTALDYYGRVYVRIILAPEVLEVSGLKFTYASVWSDENYRYLSHANPETTANLLVQADGITRPFTARFVELAGGGNQLSDLIGLVTLQPGLNVIPFTIPAGAVDGSTSLALINKEASDINGDDTEVYGMTRNVIVHNPAIVPVVPTLGGPTTYGLAEAMDVGVPCFWSNRQSDYDSRILAWSCDVDGAIVTINEPNNESGVDVKMPAGTQAGAQLTITLQTDGGTVTRQVTLV